MHKAQYIIINIVSVVAFLLMAVDCTKGKDGAIVIGERLMHRKDEDIKKKNDVIVREVRRNQMLIDYGVSQGLSRSTMLDMSR